MKSAARRPLCGSELAAADAGRMAELVVDAIQLSEPTGFCLDFGTTIYSEEFAVLSVLKGQLEKKNIRVGYDCCDLKERPLMKGERAILFLKRARKGCAPPYEALKAMPGTDEAVKIIGEAVAEPRTG